MNPGFPNSTTSGNRTSQAGSLYATPSRLASDGGAGNDAFLETALSRAELCASRPMVGFKVARVSGRIPERRYMSFFEKSRPVHDYGNRFICIISTRHGQQELFTVTGCIVLTKQTGHQSCLK